MKIILDFDRVIFNPCAQEEALREKGALELKFDPKAWDLIKPQDYYFDDVLEFLASYPKEDLVVISAMTPKYGPNAPAFQKRKLQLSGIDQLVSKVIVMKGDKAPYVLPEKNGPTIFVDDKLVNVESVKDADSTIECVQMARPNCMSEGGVVTTRSDIPVISSLAELNDIITKL